ncbi:methyl-accepting chemotaxis sensory transducer [Richelia sinica FACHB-800]|uniref:Methyl-accepting chemotaxis sensory transducer n=1 Tax=Richelia sinica FACHB-800 TaxID=1357546 RepID=A0A975Y485_9NOST|nr:methyl-accepting chemotaxis protein [Richelia sinica]MBD2666373.1 HAMP domain-containing protein [Richelia sinica FACHB-800]QXE22919.1 methyl-accepting chemotaxis sensory transducer [Richelia sinica FACHB-800]
MALSLNDYDSTYEQARTAYVQQDYETAANLIDQAVQNVPDDPNSRLLRGHIYYVLQQYDIAKEEYQNVLYLTDDPEIVSFAHNGLDNINQNLGFVEAEDNFTTEDYHQSNGLVTGETESLHFGASDQSADEDFELPSFGDYVPSVEDDEHLPTTNPFADSIENFDNVAHTNNGSAMVDDPFAFTDNEQNHKSNSNGEISTIELPPFWQEEESLEEMAGVSDNPFGEHDLDHNSGTMDFSPFGELDLSTQNGQVHESDLFTEPQSSYSNLHESAWKNNSGEDDMYPSLEAKDVNHVASIDQEEWLEQNAAGGIEPLVMDEEMPSAVHNFIPPEERVNTSRNFDSSNFDDDSFDLEAFESAFGSDTFSSFEDNSAFGSHENSKSNIEFLNDFDEFDDLGDIPGFDVTGAAKVSADSFSTGDSSFTSGSIDSADLSGQFTDSGPITTGDRDEELFTITGAQEVVPVFTQPDVAKLEPNVSNEQGWFAFFENASLDKKPWYIATGVGLASAVLVAIVSSAVTTISPPQQRVSVRNTGWAMSLAAGLAGAVTAGFMSNLTLKQIRQTTKDLQAQFDAVRQGNLNVQATVYSEDELGYLSTAFNDMARVIFTTTNEAQRKAVEQEEAKENLQRQVIRLLDDVEGAARGDLTVQAEVTADVLGAVADAFNLTIQNLRDIVQQVKVAAREVTKGSTNSETFARALSSDALRQAEELAVTLNSVQVMTESIQRVAEAAREAEAVARDASAIALKGGDAVENTVAGILEIRETVAETTRKVKRLAESSQEINSIVALVSQIASRTNLLALNASIEAARAGEAGRGFAIVADEVRQLADKSAKSLKEIEQIVMQIQSETSSVMTAMEEGTQQVIKGTKLAEEAKRALDNIIQVANRIDTLVRSITSDTVEQTETSRAVAQVMQSVELTAQETSQEAQRVSGALQHLVGVSRDLIASVERFRVETIESSR